MKLFCDYDVFIGRIKHQFVLEIDSKSRQIISEGDEDADINILNDSLKELTLNQNNKQIKTSKVNQSGFVRDVIDGAGMDPIKLFNDKKKVHIDQNIERLFKLHEI